MIERQDIDRRARRRRATPRGRAKLAGRRFSGAPLSSRALAAPRPAPPRADTRLVFLVSTNHLNLRNFRRREWYPAPTQPGWSASDLRPPSYVRFAGARGGRVGLRVGGSWHQRADDRASLRALLQVGRGDPQADRYLIVWAKIGHTSRASTTDARTPRLQGFLVMGATGPNQ